MWHRITSIFLCCSDVWPSKSCWRIISAFVTVLSEESTLKTNSLGFNSGSMIHVRLDAYVFEIFSKCKVLVSATVLWFVLSFILHVCFCTRICPSSRHLWREKVSQEDEWVILWSLSLNKRHPLTEPNDIKRLRWFASQHQRWRSCGCRLSNQMIPSDVKADQRCGEWRWANNIQVESFASLSLWAELIRLSSCSTVCVTGRTWLSKPLTLKTYSRQEEEMSTCRTFWPLTPLHGGKQQPITALQQALTCLWTHHWLILHIMRGWFHHQG